MADPLAVVIADVSASEAAQAMGRASAVIRDAARIRGVCREEIAVSVGGITTYRRCTIRGLIRAAPDQLMTAKRAGGNRVDYSVAQFTACDIPR